MQYSRDGGRNLPCHDLARHAFSYETTAWPGILLERLRIKFSHFTLAKPACTGYI
jgi:hypothetical protein